ncbi:hypothetical protein SESBI_44055 [Sesbania bispinosa]|nr:hypothetical protein SESBI_44055 [Sesbania bispinosa]
MANLTRSLGCILIVLMLLSDGSETRPLNPTMVSEMVGTSNLTPIQPVAEEEDGGQHDKQRLSPEDLTLIIISSC